MLDFAFVIFVYLANNFLPIVGGLVGSMIVVLIWRRVGVPSGWPLRVWRVRLRRLIALRRDVLALRAQERTGERLATIILVARHLIPQNLSGQIAYLLILAQDARAAAVAASLLLGNDDATEGQAQAQAKAYSIAKQLLAAMKRQSGLAVTRYGLTLKELVKLLEEALR